MSGYSRQQATLREGGIIPCLRSANLSVFAVLAIYLLQFYGNLKINKI